MGERWKHWGLFAKVRPGFIYYRSALPGGDSTTPTRLTRFAWDFGGIVEAYAQRNATLRLDVGSTLVRYLADYPDPRMSELGSVLSNKYYVNQGKLPAFHGLRLPVLRTTPNIPTITSPDDG